MPDSSHHMHRDKGNSFFDIKDVAIYILDLERGKFLYIGKPIMDLTGYIPDFFIDKGFNALFEILSEEDYGRIKEKYAASFWKPRKTRSKQPEIFSDVFRAKCKDNGHVWLENTIVILNYTQYGAPKKALGYFKKVDPEQVVNFKSRIESIRRIILSSAPPQGIAQISSIKNWYEKGAAIINKDTLLQVAFQGVMDFKLTRREREILRYIADGYSAKEIASILFISESTVVTHRRHLLTKFEVKNVAELIKEASKYFHFN